MSSRLNRAKEQLQKRLARRGIILSALLSATALAHSDELKWYFGLRVHGHFLRTSVRHSEVV